MTGLGAAGGLLVVSGLIARRNGAQIRFTNAAPVNGGSGTFANIAPKGSLLIRTDSAAVYQNTNTKASPTWSSIGTVAGLTATGAELNVLAGVTAGAAAASKGLVLDAALTVAGQRRRVLTKTASYPIVAGDSYTTIITNPTGADITITLPAPVIGEEIKIINKGTSSSVGLTVATNGGTEKVYAHGITAAGGKGLINTHATESPGDAVSLVTDGTDWFASLYGTWARVA